MKHATDWHVYHLVDPFTGLVRYVGKTADPEDRLRSHTRAWQKAFRRTPRMILLESYPSHLEASEAERKEIQSFPARQLLNVSCSGNTKRRNYGRGKTHDERVAIFTAKVIAHEKRLREEVRGLEQAYADLELIHSGIYPKD